MLPSESAFAVLHQRVLGGDALAWREIATELFPSLLKKLSRHCPAGRDEALLSDAVTQALERYLEQPARYHPERGSLAVYLDWRAKSCLSHLLLHQARRRSHEVPVGSEKLEILVENSLREGYREIEPGQVEKKLDCLIEALPVRERMFITMHLWGVRSLETYAKVLGVHGASAAVNKQVVKRAYDRIIKRLQRLARKEVVPADRSDTGVLVDLADILDGVGPFRSIRDVLEKEDL